LQRFGNGLRLHLFLRAPAPWHHFWRQSNLRPVRLA